MARYILIPLTLFLALLALCSSSILFVSASPFLPLPTASSQRIGNPRAVSLSRRTDPESDVEPQFPDDIPSCPKCAENYDSINSCAAAAPVLQNFTMIIFNPGAFIDVIKCACADTFQSTYPQCVDCLIRTNQTSFLDAGQDELPSIVSGMRKICALESTLLGNVSDSNGEVTHTSSSTPTPTSPNGAFPLSSSSWPASVIAMLLSAVAVLL